MNINGYVQFLMNMLGTILRGRKKPNYLWQWFFNNRS